MPFYHSCYSYLSQLIKGFNLLFLKIKAILTHPLPTLLGAGMINTRQKGAWEQSGLWSVEESLRALYHQLRDTVSKKLFPHYIMLSACKQQPSTKPAQQKQAGGEQRKGKTKASSITLQWIWTARVHLNFHPKKFGTGGMEHERNGH